MMVAAANHAVPRYYRMPGYPMVREARRARRAIRPYLRSAVGQSICRGTCRLGYKQGEG